MPVDPGVLRRERARKTHSHETSFMSRELSGERLPLPHEPGDLLFGLFALARDSAGPLAVGVQRRISQRSAEASQPLFQHMDLALDLVEAAPELTHFATHARLRARASVWHPVRRRGAWSGRIAGG